MSTSVPRRLLLKLGQLPIRPAHSIRGSPQPSPSSCLRTPCRQFASGQAKPRLPPTRPFHPARLSLLASGGLLSALGLWQLVPPSNPVADDNNANDTRDPTKPRFRLSEVKRHDAKSGAPWVTRGDKVYDITDWVQAHPGGDVILRAAGGSIDPYWNIFTIHKAAHVYEILEQYLIGYIDMADLVDGQPAKEVIEDPFADDPMRDQRLLTLTAKPRNAETPTGALADSFLTPNELFYVRNHMWVPTVEGNGRGHTLTVELLDGSEKTYSLEELKSKFQRHKITAVLQCSGNRRKHMSVEAAPTNGLQWTVGAISCAEWEGVKLSDVLADAGFSIDAALREGSDTKHVQFSGLEAYGASIPLQTAIDPRGDVLLAFAMNGQPLPRDHGFPLRALVPGHVAARSVKWLSRVALSDEESTSQWQRRDYKCFGPNEGSNPDWDKAPAIQQMPITSAITSVELGEWTGLSEKEPGKAEQANEGDKTNVNGGRRASVQGYAYSGGGRAICRVDISLDGGKTWDQAKLIDGCGDDNGPCKGSKSWAWRRWQYEGVVPLTEPGEGGSGACSTLLVKATDDAYNSQPESYKAIYNVRGNLANAWHRMKVCSGCGGNEASRKDDAGK